MIGSHPSEIVRIVSALLSPFILMFGLYVIAHGHYGPGGGFAGGVVLAVGVILVRLTADEALNHRAFPPSGGIVAGGTGMALFIAVAVAPVLVGGAFLDYGQLAVGDVSPAQLRYLGILVVEIAVGLAVLGAMMLIFDVVTGGAHAAGPAGDEGESS